MPYAPGTGTSLSSAVQALANRLSDPTLVQWSFAELSGYLVEALRTWQALTGSTKDTGVFNAAPGTVFYDLPTVLPALRGYTVRSTDLVALIQYHLLEPPNPTGWSGTAQFALQDILSAIQERRDRFLEETKAVLTIDRIPVLSSPSAPGRIPAAENMVGVSRLAWKDTAGGVWPLQRDSEWGLNAYRPTWVQVPSTPRIFSTSATKPLEIQLAPAPSASGTVEGLFVETGPPVLPGGTLLGIPDDWAWVIKWGALAALLSRDGLALDPLRAQYCDARWQHGVQLAKQVQVPLAARIANQSAQIDLVAHADAYHAGWEQSPGDPVRVLYAGHNVVALAPPPDEQLVMPSWSVTLDLVCNMPVPSLSPSMDEASQSVLQVDQGLLPLIYDYAEHLASFKLGPGQLQAAQGLLDRFLQAAGTAITMRALWGAQKSRPVEALPEDRYMPGTAAPVGVH